MRDMVIERISDYLLWYSNGGCKQMLWSNSWIHIPQGRKDHINLQKDKVELRNSIDEWNLGICRMCMKIWDLERGRGPSRHLLPCQCPEWLHLLSRHSLESSKSRGLNWWVTQTRLVVDMSERYCLDCELTRRGQPTLGGTILRQMNLGYIES